jgi:GTP-binding protein HflX
LFERPGHGERALLVQIGSRSRPPQDQVDEFRDLATSAGARVVGTITGVRRDPDPRHYIGRGKLEEVREALAAGEADLVLVNHSLSPSQERNLERELKCRVLDRTGLILDIFAQRARSHEGKLQVELAQLRHLATRLVRGWTHLERQKGGIGLRGPGETQLETDRRLLGQRIKVLRERLDKVARQRAQGRRTRMKAEMPTVSLVGYTNAGKSTLFNYLTEGEVYAADQLFATLDPTLRRVEAGGGPGFVLADTVGFVRDLPHELVAAFRATLEETREASLLLHVVDVTDPNRDERIEQVNAVLEEIGAGDVPQIMVFNKIDLSGDAPRVHPEGSGRLASVWLSAVTGEGVDGLVGTLDRVLRQDHRRGRLDLDPAEGRIRAALFEAGAVTGERPRDDGGWTLDVDVSQKAWMQLCARTGIEPERLVEPSSCSPHERLLESRSVA